MRSFITNTNLYKYSLRFVMQQHRHNLKGYDKYQYPTFWTGGTVPPLFRTQVKNLLSAAVNRSDLWRLKTFSSQGSATDATRVPHDAHPYPTVEWGRDTLPIYMTFS